MRAALDESLPFRLLRALDVGDGALDAAAGVAANRVVLHAFDVGVKSNSALLERVVEGFTIDVALGPIDRPDDHDLEAAGRGIG